MNYRDKIINLALELGPGCTSIVRAFYEKYDPQFSDWSGCHVNRGHHFGRGGLELHVWEVISLCMSTADFYSQPWTEHAKTINKEVLFIAALFHDIGKIWDYDILDNFKSVPHKRKIHHISRSAIEWNGFVLAGKYHMTAEFVDDVTHCILSHHGQRQFGSPVAPFTREAWILHLCDSMSARVEDCDRLDMITVNK